MSIVALPVADRRPRSPLPRPWARSISCRARRLDVGLGPGSSRPRTTSLAWADPVRRSAGGASTKRCRRCARSGRGTPAPFAGALLRARPTCPSRRLRRSRLTGPPHLGDHRQLGLTAGLRRVARLGDGWLASCYNAPPSAFEAAARPARQHARVTRSGVPATFPDALATAWLHVTDDAVEVTRDGARSGQPRWCADPSRQLADRLPIGSPRSLRRSRFGRYRDAGVATAAALAASG